MRSLIFLPLLAACAPAHLEQAKASVDNRMEHVNYSGWSRPAGMPENKGNCAAFALAYWKELKQAGHNPPLPVACTLPSGERHAVLKYDGYVLDNRYSMPVPIDGYDCKPI